MFFNHPIKNLKKFASKIDHNAISPCFFNYKSVDLREMAYQLQEIKEYDNGIIESSYLQIREWNALLKYFQPDLLPEYTKIVYDILKKYIRHIYTDELYYLLPELYLNRIDHKRIVEKIV